MNRQPNVSGGGAQTNRNGLSFEQRTSLIQAIRNNTRFRVRDTAIANFLSIDLDDQKVGYYTEKNAFYTGFLERRGVQWQSIISKRYLPDAVLVNERNHTIYVIEKKFQTQGGSVDEKLQTCDFKKKIYQKLVKSIPGTYEVEYFYLLNDWFERSEYEDVKNYIVDVGCRYFINWIELADLGIG